MKSLPKHWQVMKHLSGNLCHFESSPLTYKFLGFLILCRMESEKAFIRSSEYINHVYIEQESNVIYYDRVTGLYIVSCYLKIIWTAFICGLKKLWFNSILMQAFHSMPRLGMLTYLPDKHFNHVLCTCVCYFPWQVVSQIVKTTPSISKGSRKFFRTLQNNGIFNICIMLFVKQNYMYLHCCNMFCDLENRCCIGHHPHTSRYVWICNFFFLHLANLAMNTGIFESALQSTKKVNV